ncbi:MAG: alpha/beta hydrolase fold domain-containing protein [Lewinellaceae bacterium]|nr:alpha/beta hydrolase fold domain-containing protein [Lewinellaceae bacterium]
MEILKDIQLVGAAGRPFLLDAYYVPDGKAKPIVIFCHGFKGFKDWGHWDLLAKAFATAGFVFVKFNFSHNGTNILAPMEFADLEAFGMNNYSKELSDLDAVLLWLHRGDNGLPAHEAALSDINLIGHSRGGAICVIKAAQDPRIRKLATWAAVSRLDYAWNGPDFMQEWKKKGVYYVLNARTGQQMPLYYQLYQDFKAKEQALDVKAATQSLKKPMLIVHGTADAGVPADAARQLQAWNEGAKLYLIEGADHVFGGSHPYSSDSLPAHSQELAAVTISFMNEK